MPDTKIISKEEAKCEELFRNEHKRTTNGKFEIISLSFREDPSVFGESKINALKRLHHLECRFQRDPQLQIQYISFMNEYIKLSYTSALPDTKGMKVNYLPHHSVLKKKLTLTKRVVFNASSPTTSGKSLHCLLVDQPELFDTLLRFRQLYLCCDKRYWQDVDKS